MYEAFVDHWCLARCWRGQPLVDPGRHAFDLGVVMRSRETCPQSRSRHASVSSALPVDKGCFVGALRTAGFDGSRSMGWWECAIDPRCWEREVSSATGSAPRWGNRCASEPSERMRRTLACHASCMSASTAPPRQLTTASLGMPFVQPDNHLPAAETWLLY
jgi:hypothetical protein